MNITDFNNLPKQVLPMWATPLYASFIPGSASFVKEVNNLSWKRTEGDDGWITEEAFILDREEFKILKDNIEHHINFFVKEVAQYLNVDFYITNSWAVKHGKNDWAPKHFHSNCIFSGIVYLKCNNESGDIVFHKNPGHTTLASETFLFDVKDYNNFNNTTENILPQQEQILIFPSHVEHRVTKSQSSEERIAIAFNTFFKGNLGSNINTLSSLNLK